MTEYTSKQVQITKPAEVIFQALSSFANFTPIVADKVDGWDATDEKCSFKAQGFSIKLKMMERDPHKTIKITGDELPFEFYFWVQLKSVDTHDTRLRLTLHAKLNLVMRTMLGSKLQKGLDQIAENIALSFNNA